MFKERPALLKFRIYTAAGLKRFSLSLHKTQSTSLDEIMFSGEFLRMI